MASGLQSLAEMPFQGSGSQSASMMYLELVARVAGEATGDEQLLQIAAALANESTQSAQSAQPMQPGVA